jgi:hypothetical protein
MIYIIIWAVTISFIIGIQLGKKTYHIELKNKLKNRLKVSEEALLDYTVNYFELWK